MYLLDNDADYFSKYYGEGVAVAIQQPTKRLVKIKSEGNLAAAITGNDDCKIERLNPNGRFYLSFPHVVFRIGYVKKKVYSPESLAVAFATSLQPKRVYVPPLFNIGDTLDVCIPLRGEFKTLSDLCRYCITSFWKTEFNDSMYDAFESTYAEKQNSILANYAKWQTKTKENPNWIPTARSMEEYGSYRDFYEETRLPEVDEANW